MPPLMVAKGGRFIKWPTDRRCSIPAFGSNGHATGRI